LSGTTFATAIRESGVDRAEVFVETKIWISDSGYDETLHSEAASVTRQAGHAVEAILRRR